MNRKLVLVVAVFAIAAAALFGQKATGKKVLYLDSYNSDYAWSAGILDGITAGLKGSGVTFDVLHMDTKNNPSADFAKQAALNAKAYIEKTRPDVVIASDDNATRLVIMPYFKDAALPVVHLGLNWDASIYGMPYTNTTGMIEVSHVKELVARLLEYAKGRKVGFITGDSETERKELKYYKLLFNLEFASEKFVTTFADWKVAYKEMAGSVDAIFFGNNAAIKGWDAQEAASLVGSVTKIPTGTINGYVMPFAMIGMVKPPEEFGVWGAQTALRILGGAAPSSIPSTQNKQTKFQLNVKLASAAGIVFKPALIKNATIVQ